MPRITKAVSRAMAYAGNPPPGVRFIPLTSKLMPVKIIGGRDYVAPDHFEMPNELFDLMQIGDPVIIQTSNGCMPCVCIRTGLNRTWKAIAGGAIYKERHFLQHTRLWRVPYCWRPAVLGLRDAYYPTIQEVERAMEEQAGEACAHS